MIGTVLGLTMLCIITQRHMLSAWLWLAMVKCPDGVVSKPRVSCVDAKCCSRVQTYHVDSIRVKDTM